MNKILRTITAATLCLSALSTQAFADDILTDKSVYAENGEELSKAYGNEEWEGEQIYVDPNNVIPIYTADLYDYARTGEFVVQPSIAKKGQRYIANAIDKNGNYKGRIDFYSSAEKTGYIKYSHTEDKSKSIDFQSDTKRIKAAMTSSGINTDCKEIKLLFVQNVGYVYYIDNGETKLLAAAGFQEVDGEIFNDENKGVIEIGAELKAIADKELAELEEYQKYLDSLAPGENPVTDGNRKTYYLADNTPYLADENPSTMGGDSTPDENPPTFGGDSDSTTKNSATGANPDTGSTGAVLVLGTAIAACGVIISSKKRNKQ